MSESFPATIAATKLGVFSDMSGQFLVRIFLTNRVMPRLFAGKMCISREMPGLYAASNWIYISRCVHLAGCQDKFQPRQRHQNWISLSRRRGSLQVFLKTCLDNFPAVHMAANLDIFQETGQFLAFNLGIFGKMSGKFIAVFAAAKQDIFAKMLRPLAVKKRGILRETFGKLPARLLARKFDVFFDKTTEYFATKKQVF